MSSIYLPVWLLARRLERSGKKKKLENCIIIRIWHPLGFAICFLPMCTQWQVVVGSTKVSSRCAQEERGGAKGKGETRQRSWRRSGGRGGGRKVGEIMTTIQTASAKVTSTGISIESRKGEQWLSRGHLLRFFSIYSNNHSGIDCHIEHPGTWASWAGGATQEAERCWEEGEWKVFEVCWRFGWCTRTSHYKVWSLKSTRFSDPKWLSMNGLHFYAFLSNWFLKM